MKKLFLCLIVLVARPAVSADITNVMECSAIQSTTQLTTTGDTRFSLELVGSLTSGCTIVVEGAFDPGGTFYPIPIYREELAEISWTASLTSSNTALSKVWVGLNAGYNAVRVRMSTLGNPGSVTVRLTGAAGEGRRIITTTSQHPNAFSCSMITTAIVLTQINGCTGSITGNLTPTGANSLYITDAQIFSSIISTVTNFPLLRSGSGLNCVTSPADVWRGFAPTAFGGSLAHFS